jgi:ubiquinone/menaquinone biosynthesis C-methylase UbiE
MLEENAKIYRCPQCLRKLILDSERREGTLVETGRLNCKNCSLSFPIEDGMVFFGLDENKREERIGEMNAEKTWNFNATSIEEHLKYGQTHHPRANAIIRHIKDITNTNHGETSVLDVGAGAGAISYLLSRHGFQAFATELGPENLAIGRKYSEKAWFERAVSDAAVLPFGDGQFDVVFCKEIAHHMGDLKSFLLETARVLKRDGLMVLIEPCLPKFRGKEQESPDLEKETGLNHQDYHMFSYLSGLKAAGIAVDEMLTSHFQGNRHPALVKTYNFARRITGADGWKKGFWLDKLVSLFFGGSVIFIGKKYKEFACSATRSIEIISPDRIVQYRDQIEHVKHNIQPFIELLDKTYNAAQENIGNESCGI